MKYHIKRWLRACVALVVAIFVLPQSALAVPLIRGLGGPAGYGTNFLDYNDDGSSRVIDVSMSFRNGLRFFGRTYSELYVNNNGNITFGAGVAAYTPRPFPVAAQRMIAPWWGDVDTRGGGRPAMNGVWWDIRPHQFTVTWDHVGYFSSHDDLQNSFQLILRPSPSCGMGDFDVEFRYERCEWTSGDASGGRMGTCIGQPATCTPAQAGFDAGDQRNFYTLPFSRTDEVLRLCSTSNVGEPGVWRFQIRGGELPCNGSGTACVTGYPGACAAGTIQCRSGRPTCVPDNRPEAERCDGVDNDCDGMVDENDGAQPQPLGVPDGGFPDTGVPSSDASNSDGASDVPNVDMPNAPMDVPNGDAGRAPPLCVRGGEVCERGVCVPGCVEGACFPNQTCVRGTICVETNCLNVNCPEGQVCHDGMCIDGCDSVQCPQPLACRFGRCVNLCDGVRCDSGQVCDRTTGRCVAGCQCAPCPAMTACQDDGRCIPPRCVDVTCEANEFCDARGRCVNVCDEMGVQCPIGQECNRMTGRCAEPPPPGPEPPMVRDDMRPPPTDTGVIDDMPSGAMDGGVVADSGYIDPFMRRGGCACRVPTAPSSAPSNAPSSIALAALGLAALAASKRRRSA
jgi:MYXO-CTERM domain-containing protein